MYNQIVVAFIMLMFIHWIGDFVYQTDEMAKGKSTPMVWLFKHCFMYTVILMIGTINPMFAIFNGMAHFVVDYFTSKLNSWLWNKGDVHNFFCCIGLDQLIHLTILFVSYIMFVN